MIKLKLQDVETILRYINLKFLWLNPKKLIISTPHTSFVCTVLGTSTHVVCCI